MDDHDLPDFDFDFHPSEKPAQPAPKRALDFDIPDFSTRDAFEPPKPTLRSERMDHPTIERPVERPVEHVQPRFEMPELSESRPVERPVQRTEPQYTMPEPKPHPVERPVEAPKHPDVIMRGGTLFIEKHALIRHVHDLSDLKGLSSSTHEQFQRVDNLAKDEKAILDDMRATIQTIYDTLEQADGLLFSGE